MRNSPVDLTVPHLFIDNLFGPNLAIVYPSGKVEYWFEKEMTFTDSAFSYETPISHFHPIYKILVESRFEYLGPLS